MRSMFKTMPLALCAVLAVSAVMASSAFATPEWEAKTGGVFTKITTALKVKTSGTNFQMADTKFAGLSLSKCSIEWEGNIETKGLGTITKMSVSGCTGGERCSGGATLSIGQLPWKTELYESAAKTVRNRIVSGGHGTPEWHLRCTSAGLVYEDTCYMNTSAGVLNNPFEGEINPEENFDSESANTTCSQGGANSGWWRGELKIGHPAGTEAIRVKK